MNCLTYMSVVLGREKTHIFFHWHKYTHSLTETSWHETKIIIRETNQNVQREENMSEIAENARSKSTEWKDWFLSAHRARARPLRLPGTHNRTQRRWIFSKFQRNGVIIRVILFKIPWNHKKRSVRQKRQRNEKLQTNKPIEDSNNK